MENHRIIPFRTNLVQRHKLNLEIFGGKIDTQIFQKTHYLFVGSIVAGFRKPAKEGSFVGIVGPESFG